MQISPLLRDDLDGEAAYLGKRRCREGWPSRKLPGKGVPQAPEDLGGKASLGLAGLTPLTVTLSEFPSRLGLSKRERDSRL